MDFWQQFAIQSAVAALHTVVRRFGQKYLTQEELTAADTVLDGLADLPARIHGTAPTPAKA